MRRGRSPRGRGYLALTFSTLLSSQGASAHRIKGLSAGHRGNSLTLPVDLPPVKRSGFGSLGLPHTDTDRSNTNRADGGGSGHRRGTGHLDRCPFLPVRRTSRTLRRSTDPVKSISGPAGRGRSSAIRPSSWSKPARVSRAVRRLHDASEPEPATFTTTHRLPRIFPTSDHIGIPAIPGGEVATAPVPTGYSQLAGTRRHPRRTAIRSGDGPHCADAALAAPQDDPLPKQQVRRADRLLGVGDLAVVDVRASLGHRPPPG